MPIWQTNQRAAWKKVPATGKSQEWSTQALIKNTPGTSQKLYEGLEGGDLASSASAMTIKCTKSAKNKVKLPISEIKVVSDSASL